MDKKSRRRDLGKERFWRKALRRRERNGLTVRAFCREEGLTESAYYFWRSELRKRDGDRGSSSARRRDCRRVPQQVRRSPTFASVTVADAVFADQTTPIEIVLGGDVRVRVGRGFDPRALREVLGVLEAGAC